MESNNHVKTFSVFAPSLSAADIRNSAQLQLQFLHWYWSLVLKFLVAVLCLCADCFCKLYLSEGLIINNHMHFYLESMMARTIQTISKPLGKSIREISVVNILIFNVWPSCLLLKKYFTEIDTPSLKKRKKFFIRDMEIMVTSHNIVSQN